MTGQRAKFQLSVNGRPALDFAQMMNLKEVVDRYLSLAGSFAKPVRLAAFGLPSAETEALFGALDEDYHISRYLRFSCEPAETHYMVSGEKMTHVAIDAGVRELL